MAETGFRFFIEALQAMNAPPKPKQKPIKEPKPKPEPRQDRAVRLDYSAEMAPSPVPDEDYTGSVCLLHKLTALTPVYLQVLIDIEDFDRVAHLGWHIVYEGKYREPRVAHFGRPRYLHRLVTDAPRGLVVDHRYHNTLDSRKSRLRVCTTRENNLNRRPRRNASSRYKGVTRCSRSGKWKVQCGARGSAVYLGTYDSEVEAATVYNRYVAQTYGSMAYQNVIG